MPASAGHPESKTQTPQKTDGTSTPAPTAERSKDGRPVFKTPHYGNVPVKERGAIRILMIWPCRDEEAEVQCELVPGTILQEKDRLPHEMNITPFKPYDALSWCWGKDPSDSVISIMIDGTSHVKYVQRGLAKALRALRHGIYVRCLWVDAICIDQENKDEKNVQVEMMAEIYGQADYVRIWLGDSNKSSNEAILFIKQQILQLQHFDDLSSSVASSDKWKALLELMQRDWFSRRWVVQEVTLAKKAMLHCGKAKLAWTKFAVAVELFVEVETATHRLSEVMKTDAKYNHVPRWFEYISQLGASLLVDATGTLFRDYEDIHSGVEKGKRTTKLAKQIPPDQNELSYDSEDEEVVSPQDMAARYDLGKGDRHRKSIGQPLLTLEYLVSSMSIFGVTNPHDSVYALLGIAKDTTPTAVHRQLRVTDHTQAALEMWTTKKHYPVDYNAPYRDICKEFIQFCIRQNMKRDPSRALDVICRPWAVVVEDEDQDPLPSWLPRLSKASYGMVLGPGIDGMRMGRRNADSLVGLPNVTHRNYNAAETKGLDKRTFRFRKRVVQLANSMNDIIAVPGVTRYGSENGTVNGTSPTVASTSDGKAPDSSVVPVDRVIDSSGPEDSPSPLSKENDAVKPPRDSISASEVDGADGRAADDAAMAKDDEKSRKGSSGTFANYHSLYVKGFKLDVICSVQPSSQSGSIPTVWARFAGWESMEGTPPDYFWRTLVADRGSQGQNPPVYYSRACQESFRKGGTSQGVVDTTGLIEHERNSVVAQFCRRVQAAIWNRALVKTRNDNLGLVPNNVKEGDHVCILYGCSVPVVLRRSVEKAPSVIKNEMEMELKHIANHVVENSTSHLERRRLFQGKRESDKRLYSQWLAQKRDEWNGDLDWKSHWKLVRVGLRQVHDLRAWVTKEWAPGLEKQGDCEGAENAIEIMKDCAQVLLGQIHELAVWCRQAGELNCSIIEHFRNVMHNGADVPASFEVLKKQHGLWKLWDSFTNDTHWQRLWKEDQAEFAAVEGFKAYARHHKLEIGWEADRKDAEARWKNRSGDSKEWLDDWEAENTWYMCIDSFQAWTREKGRLVGTSDVLPHKEDWDRDVEWRKKRKGDDRLELQSASFSAWMEAKKRDNPESEVSKKADRPGSFTDWFNSWQLEHRDASEQEIFQAWDIEKKRRIAEAQIEEEEHEAEVKRKLREKAEKLDREPFLERWRSGWNPPTVNWEEFELALRCCKHWLKLVRRYRKDHMNDQETWWRMAKARGDRQKIRTRNYPSRYGTEEAREARRRTKSASLAKVHSPDSAEPPAGSNSLSNSRNTETINKSLQSNATFSSASETIGSTIDPATNSPENGSADVSDSANGEGATENGSEKDYHVHAATGEIQGSTSLTPAPKLPGTTTTEEPACLGATTANEGEIENPATQGKLPNGQNAVLHRPGTTISSLQEIEKGQNEAWLLYRMSLMAEPLKSRTLLWKAIEKKKDDYPVAWRKSDKAVSDKCEVWKDQTPKYLGKDGAFHYDCSRPKPNKHVFDSKETIIQLRRREAAEEEETARRRSCRAAHVEDEGSMCESQTHCAKCNPKKVCEKCQCHRPKGYYFGRKIRDRLPEAKAKEWMKQVRKTFQERLGDDGRWYYTMIGECYIHGMMDGEAMKYQNDNGISYTVFEIR